MDIGFTLLPEFWGRGYATEAAAATLEYGREVLGFRSEGVIQLAGDAERVKLFAWEA